MTIYSEDSDENIIVKFDSRWRFPETLGYKPTDPEYAELQKLWEEATGETIPGKETAVTTMRQLCPQQINSGLCSGEFQ